MKKKVKRPGLWANIRKRRAEGKPPAKKGSKAYNKAKAAGEKINRAAKSSKKK